MSKSGFGFVPMTPRWRPSVILDFKKSKLYRVERVNMHLCAKFHEELSNRCRDMEIKRF